MINIAPHISKLWSEASKQIYFITLKYVYQIHLGSSGRRLQSYHHVTWLYVDLVEHHLQRWLQRSFSVVLNGTNYTTSFDHSEALTNAATCSNNTVHPSSINKCRNTETSRDLTAHAVGNFETVSCEFFTRRHSFYCMLCDKPSTNFEHLTAQVSGNTSHDYRACFMPRDLFAGAKTDQVQLFGTAHKPLHFHCTNVVILHFLCTPTIDLLYAHQNQSIISETTFCSVIWFLHKISAC